MGSKASGRRLKILKMEVKGDNQRSQQGVDSMDQAGLDPI